MKLIIVRHAKTEWNQQGRLQGRLDSPLAPQADEQIERLAQSLSDYHFSAVYISPSQRCITTYERLARQKSSQMFSHYRVLDLLQEQCFGKYEGMKKDEIATTQPEILSRIRGEYPEQKLCSQSESLEEVQQRANAFITFLRQNNTDEDTILAVSHGNFIKALLLSALNEPAESLTHGNCAFSEIDIKIGAINVIRWGVSTHIKSMLLYASRN